MGLLRVTSTSVMTVVITPIKGERKMEYVRTYVCDDGRDNAN